jgi:2-polyprenyl-3-methyl-5-hydroxy-6-metoxy-1,4-benzoquinol methylase
MVQQDHKTGKKITSQCSRKRFAAGDVRRKFSVIPSLILWTPVSWMVCLCSTTQVHTFPCSSYTTILPTRVRHSPQQPSFPRSILIEATSQRFGGGVDEGSGGRGGGFASKSTSKRKTTKKQAEKKFSKEALLKQVERKYGGSTPQDIARGTQVMIDQAIQELPPHLQLALKLYQRDIDWQRRISGMDVFTQSKLPPQLIEQAQHVQKEFQALLQEHALTKQDLQSTVQQITWNASADAKAVKSLTGTMPRDIQHRVQRACEYAAQTTTVGGGRGDNEKGNVLDVGCGYGVLVPYLKQAGLAASQIHGMDLSPEMIRNARSFFPDVTLQVTNFLTISDTNTTYQAVLFCSSLHDLPDIPQALNKAYDLLETNGRLIIVHPQGASHVAQQHKANPVLVPRGLPTTSELNEWFCGGDSDDDNNDEKRMELTVAPADPKSEQEIREGYLAVLTKL